LLSPTLRQSGELFRDKLLPLWSALGRPLLLRPPTQLSLELANGSRIISLPESEGGIRGYSGVRLLVIDEAARVSDDLYRAVRPMLAVSQGRLIAMSTPFGKRGFFYEEWSSRRPWQRVKITAAQCPRITAEFLREEREALGERWMRQEYFCTFESTVGAVFSQSDIDAAMSQAIPPLFA
jgi:phage FluMu gp28-like protein